MLFLSPWWVAQRPPAADKEVLNDLGTYLYRVVTVHKNIISTRQHWVYNTPSRYSTIILNSLEINLYMLKNDRVAVLIQKSSNIRYFFPKINVDKQLLHCLIAK